MRWASISLALAWVAMVQPTHADLAMHGRSTVVSMGMQGVGQETLWLKKNRIRRDLVDRGKAYTQLYDLDTREVTLVNHALRQAEARPLAVLSKDADARVAGEGSELTVKPTGRQRRLQGWRCEEHELAFAMPMELNGERLSFQLAGSVWLAKKTREGRETAAFVQALKAHDFLTSLPALNRVSATQAQGLSEAIRRIAPLGLLCSVELDLKYEGSGRVAELSRKLASHVGLEYDRYDTAPIADDTFDIPAGYVLLRR